MVGVVLGLVVGGVAAAAQDPYRPQQWNLDRIGAPQAWSLARGQGQVVAIVDSGVDLEHPDLADRFLRRADGEVLGRDVVDDDDVPQDPLGHGTMVAGIAVATFDNGIGVAGVAPEARLLPVRVLDEDGRGTSSDVEKGIRWAVDHGATVVNLSLESAMAGDGDTLLGSATVAAPVDAVEYAWEHGVVVVAAAGNSGNGFTDYPRSSPVVLVGATDHDDERSEFSDSGRDDLLMAPGVDVVSTWCREAGDERCRPDTHSYGIADGTSFAAPHVAGAVAVVRSAGLDHRQTIDRLRSTARDIDREGRDDQTGYGLVDLAAATKDLMKASPSGTTASPAPSPEPTRTATPPPASPDPVATTPATPPSPPSSSPTTGTPTATDAPSTPPTTSPPPSEREITTPDVEASPIAAPDDLGGGARLGWVLVALVLLAVSAGSVGREWLRTR